MLLEKPVDSKLLFLDYGEAIEWINLDTKQEDECFLPKQKALKTKQENRETNIEV